MMPDQIMAEHVRAAIAEIDRGGVPPLRQSVGYHLVYQGRRYPPKYVVSRPQSMPPGESCRRVSSTADRRRIRSFKAWDSTSNAKAPWPTYVAKRNSHREHESRRNTGWSQRAMSKMQGRSLGFVAKTLRQRRGPETV